MHISKVSVLAGLYLLSAGCYCFPSTPRGGRVTGMQAPQRLLGFPLDHKTSNHDVGLQSSFATSKDQARRPLYGEENHTKRTERPDISTPGKYSHCTRPYSKPLPVNDGDSSDERQSQNIKQLLLEARTELRKRSLSEQVTPERGRKVKRESIYKPRIVPMSYLSLPRQIEALKRGLEMRRMYEMDGERPSWCQIACSSVRSL